MFRLGSIDSSSSHQGRNSNGSDGGQWLKILIQGGRRRKDSLEASGQDMILIENQSVKYLDQQRGHFNTRDSDAAGTKKE